MVFYQNWVEVPCFVLQHELTAAEPLDELYDALAEVVAAEEEPVCYKTYLLVK